MSKKNSKNGNQKDLPYVRPSRMNIPAVVRWSDVRMFAY
jgi:hypothetical protein